MDFKAGYPVTCLVLILGTLSGIECLLCWDNMSYEGRVVKTECEGSCGTQTSKLEMFKKKVGCWEIHWSDGCKKAGPFKLCACNQPLCNQPDTELQDNNLPVTELQDNNLPATELQDNNQPVTELQDNNLPVTELQDNNQPDTELQDNNQPDTELHQLDTKITVNNEKPGTELQDNNMDITDQQLPALTVGDIMCYDGLSGPTGFMYRMPCHGTCAKRSFINNMVLYICWPKVVPDGCKTIQGDKICFCNTPLCNTGGLPADIQRSNTLNTEGLPAIIQQSNTLGTERPPAIIQRSNTLGTRGIFAAGMRSNTLNKEVIPAVSLRPNIINSGEILAAIGEKRGNIQNNHRCWQGYSDQIKVSIRMVRCPGSCLKKELRKGYVLYGCMAKVMPEGCSTCGDKQVCCYCNEPLCNTCLVPDIAGSVPDNTGPIYYNTDPVPDQTGFFNNEAVSENIGSFLKNNEAVPDSTEHFVDTIKLILDKTPPVFDETWHISDNNEPISDDTGLVHDIF